MPCGSAEAKIAESRQVCEHARIVNYDALYVQLAEQLDALVLTTDAALARAVPERIQHVIAPSSG